VIPCHRIIGTSGKLTGYAGGLWRKEWLLNHEKSIKDRSIGMKCNDKQQVLNKRDIEV